MLVVALLIAAQPPDFAADFRGARARLEALNAREAELSARVGKNREAQARLLSALQTARRDPPPALLVSPQSAKDAVRAAILMRALEPELERRAKALAAEATQLARLRREATEASAALFAAESVAADRAATGGAKASHGHPTPAAPTLAVSPTPLAPLRPPATGEIVRRFGDPWPGQGRSEGLSWKVAPGAPVVSPTDGRVEYVGPLKNWGLVVVTQRPDGWRTVVAGLQSADLAPGSIVRSGQAIGRAPQRVSPDPELYLELRRGSDPVDPSPYILRPAL